MRFIQLPVADFAAEIIPPVEGSSPVLEVYFDFSPWKHRYELTLHLGRVLGKEITPARSTTLPIASSSRYSEKKFLKLWAAILGNRDASNPIWATICEILEQAGTRLV